MLIYLQMIETQQDKGKFEKLYHAYRGLMFGVANRILRNEKDAEDAVHEAFVSIAKNFEKISEPECPKTRAYVVIVVERKAIDLYRRKHRRSHVPFDEDTLGLEIDYAQAHTIAKCFAMLPIRYRHVLSLKYRYGYNDREIAKLLNLTVSNTTKLIQRAKAKLGAICREEGILE